MSETITEMILPGTYIDVRAEGLIGVGGIATGNVGVVGTASRGPVNVPVILGSFAEALDTFGPSDRWPDTAIAQTSALTLTRALQLAFAGGASTVYAVRIGPDDMPATQWAVLEPAPGGATLVTLTAATPGTWANGNDTAITIDAPAAGPVTLTITHGREKEEFTGADVGTLADAINADSRLVTAGAVAAADAAKVPRAGAVAITTQGGPDAVPATGSTVATGLAALETQPVNIVFVAGEAPATAQAALLAHLETTENAGNERLGVQGATGAAVATVVNDAGGVTNDRLILVAPGIRADDPARAGERVTTVTLPPAYGAALVAGRLASLAPHVSLTNKDLPLAGLQVEYTRSEQKALLLDRVLVLRKDLGFRVLKGITTDDGAFRQISVRRIVDYAKAGVRIGANPYIGRLNNSRVRAALKATLDGFLSSMVLDEMLIGYTLDVTATRAQEIAGQALVTMTLQPTFSIDFVKVIMNLQ
jgi:Phage tail sheath C-terminal domain/Phage tail sheath protein subtilisin-like domain